MRPCSGWHRRRQLYEGLDGGEDRPHLKVGNVYASIRMWLFACFVGRSGSTAAARAQRLNREAIHLHARSGLSARKRCHACAAAHPLASPCNRSSCGAHRTCLGGDAHALNINAAEKQSHACAAAQPLTYHHACACAAAEPLSYHHACM